MNPSENQFVTKGSTPSAQAHLNELQNSGKPVAWKSPWPVNSPNHTRYVAPKTGGGMRGPIGDLGGGGGMNWQTK